MYIERKEVCRGFRGYLKKIEAQNQNRGFQRFLEVLEVKIEKRGFFGGPKIPNRGFQRL